MLLCKRVKRDRVYFGKICCSADLRVTSAHTRHSHFPEGFVPTFFPKKILKKDMLKWCFPCCLDDKVSKHYSQKLPKIDATFPGSFVIYCINNSEVTPFPFLDWERKESDMDFTLKHFFTVYGRIWLQSAVKRLPLFEDVIAQWMGSWGSACRDLSLELQYVLLKQTAE